jgi:hypothetical protein
MRDSDTLSAIQKTIDKISKEVDLSYPDAKKLEVLIRMRNLILGAKDPVVPDLYDQYTEKDILDALKPEKVTKKYGKKKTPKRGSLKARLDKGNPVI